MIDNQIIIPEGWTYYAHRTNTANWKDDPFEMNIINVEKIMSVVTERDIHEELMHYGKNHLQGYATGKGEPFEIRCLICNLSYIRKLDDSNDLKNIMRNEFYIDKRNFGGCCGQRHHSIPPEEKLVVLGRGEYDEVFDRDCRIIWTIPRRFINFYKEEIKKGNNRAIGLNRQEEVKKK